MWNPRKLACVYVATATCLAGLSGCAPGARPAWGAPDKAAQQDVRTVLKDQVGAWNAGDIDGFMAGYWRSDELRFCSGKTMTRGWQATLDRYHRRYSSRELMGRLTFDQLDFTALADDAMLVVGRWRVEREEAVGGLFSLIFRRFDSRWVIIHDHTSVDSS